MVNFPGEQPSDASVASPLVRDAIPYARLPWIRPLVHACATDFRSVAPLFPGDPGDAATWRTGVAKVQEHGARRPPMAPILAAQLAERSAPAAARASAALLADPTAVAIVTGQQAGVFGGPLYTLLKALSTIQVARHVGKVCGVPTVPVFWVDAEDHDWNEIRTSHVLDREFAVASVTLDDLPGAGSLPVGRLTFDERVNTSVEQLFGQLAPTEYSTWLAETLRRRYRPGVRVTTAFAGLMDDLMGDLGLVVFEADDRRAKPFVARLFAQELERPCGTARAARAGGDAMGRLGHAAQIVPADDAVSLFALDARGRRPIRYRDGAFVVDDEARDAAALHAEALASPEHFSPNVLLRPLVQDTLFPTVCYVAGPSELAYQAQLAAAYAAFSIEPPLLVSRASVTLVDSAALKFLERHPLPLEALQPQDESALNRLLESQLPPALEATFADLETLLAERARPLKTVASSIDPTLAGAVDTTVDRMRDTLKSLHGKIVQASKKKDETLRRQFVRTRALAFPNGLPQERFLGIAFFLNRYGADLPSRLLTALPPLPEAAPGHRAIGPEGGFAPPRAPPTAPAVNCCQPWPRVLHPHAENCRDERGRASCCASLDRGGRGCAIRCSRLGWCASPGSCFSSISGSVTAASSTRKLAGEERPCPRIFGRPFELSAGQALSPAQFVQRLNDVGYAERPKAANPASSSLSPDSRHARDTGQPTRRRHRRFGRLRARRIARVSTHRLWATGRAAKPLARLDARGAAAGRARAWRTPAARPALEPARRTSSTRSSPSRTAASGITRASTRSASFAPSSPTSGATSPTSSAAARSRSRSSRTRSSRRRRRPAASCRNSSWRSCSSRASPSDRFSSCT